MFEKYLKAAISLISLSVVSLSVLSACSPQAPQGYPLARGWDNELSPELDNRLIFERLPKGTISAKRVGETMNNFCINDFPDVQAALEEYADPGQHTKSYLPWPAGEEGEKLGTYMALITEL